MLCPCFRKSPVCKSTSKSPKRNRSAGWAELFIRRDLSIAFDFPFDMNLPEYFVIPLDALIYVLRYPRSRNFLFPSSVKDVPTLRRPQNRNGSRCVFMG